MRRRDKHDWASTDVAWMLFGLALFALAGVDIRFFYLLLAAIPVGAGYLLLRVRRRRQREQANADAPFWADRMRDRMRDRT